MKLTDQRVLVTGVSRGIGRALVATLLSAGARVAGCARNGAALDTLRNELGVGELGVGELGVGDDRLLLATCDVADPLAVEGLVRDVEAAWGGVDVLINNAAVLPVPATVEETDPAVWSRTLQINVVGSVAAAHAALPGMRQRGQGVIVNMSSGWGRTASPRVGPYCASKFAIEAFSSTLAQEVPDGIIVVALSPGVIATDMLADAVEGDVSAYPTPESMAPDWLRFFAQLGPQSNGTSISL